MKIFEIKISEPFSFVALIDPALSP